MMSKGKRLLISLSSNAGNITVGTGGMLRLLGYSGFDVADFDLQMQPSGSIDGGYISVARIASRTLTISADIGLCSPEAIRSRLISMFSPHDDVMVTVQRGSIIRTIVGRMQSPSIAEANMHHPATVVLTILCPQPYFRDISSYGKNIAAVTPMLVFPLISTETNGVVGGVRMKAQSVTLINSGHVSTGLRAEIVATGVVTNPRIFNQTTGEYVRLIGSLTAGQQLIISTVTRQKRVTVDGMNSIHLVDRVSRFISMNLGENVIGYDADDGVNNMAVYIYYTPLYRGV